jgi:UDP-glucuronate decarboxylase
MQPDDGRVVSNFIVQALQDKPITIYGNGNQTRSFQYVNDLVDGLIRMMNTPDEIIGPVNIGNPSEFTILELAQKVIKLTSSKSTIEFHERTADDPMQRKPDITKAEELLDGWQPKINLDDGLRSTIDYFKKIVQ